MADAHLAHVDLAVLVAYLAAVIGLGIWFARRQEGADDYMSASRSLPGWAVGLSMFGSYVSSISFLANPGKSYGGNWNALVFSLATPIAAAAAVRWCVPFFRRSGEVSAYEHLEHRFGPWARTYAVACFLLYQMSRMGTVVLLLGMAVAPLTGWSIPATIICTGALMTIYTMAGGIKAVVWIGALQSLVLVAGTAACVLAVVWKVPGGVAEIARTGMEFDKFSLGSFGASLSMPTFWVILAYGLVINLSNFATDQSYVQRYITARDDREAAKSVWLTAALYVPTSAVFFFIGTGLFVLYRAQPELLDGVTKADKVFPHFIATQLPAGMAGLVVAAIFAASMDSNLNSMATLTLCDIYKRYFRPAAGERESLHVLRLATLFWGVAGTAMGLAMIRVESALDAWWQLAGMFSGGVVGLFLLGLMTRANNAAGLIGTVTGLIVIVWMMLPSFVDVPAEVRSPLDANLTIVVGTLVIFLVGLGVSKLFIASGSARG
ncbi:sodium:solute symporter [Lacipirellula sp.]|uniref:sodium:solute symporter n=1 Tax=Lacipirellula sp. TaxID=2691419 RepID=UPI003D10F249